MGMGQPLTKDEKLAARQARCFWARRRHGTAREGLMPHCIVAQMRGARFGEEGEELYPLSDSDFFKVLDATPYVAAWLGLFPDEYVRLLPQERERIFERTQY